MVERTGPGCGVRVEQAALVTCRHREPDSGCQALAEGPGGDLHTIGVPELGVAGVLDPQVRSDSMSDSSSPKPPRYSCRYSVKLLCPADSTNRSRPANGRRWGRAASPAETGCRQAGRGSSPCPDGRSYFLDCVGGQHPDGVDGGRIDIAPVVRVVRAGQGRDVVECGHVVKSSGSAEWSCSTVLVERCGRVKGFSTADCSGAVNWVLCLDGRRLAVDRPCGACWASRPVYHRA